MTRLPQKARTEAGFWMVVILVGITAWTVGAYWTSQANRQAEEQIKAQDGIVQIPTQLDSLTAKSLDAYINTDQQVTTMGTALLGGVFYLLFSNRKGGPWKRRRSVVLGSLLVSVSIFYGFLAYSYIIASLRDGNLILTGGATRWAQQGQFYTFILGVVFFANFMFHNLPDEMKM